MDFASPFGSAHPSLDTSASVELIVAHAQQRQPLKEPERLEAALELVLQNARDLAQRSTEPFDTVVVLDIL